MLCWSIEFEVRGRYIRGSLGGMTCCSFHLVNVSCFHHAVHALPLTVIAMPSALNPLPVLRTCAFRPRATVLRPQNAVIGVKRPAYRSFADDKRSVLPEAEKGTTGPNMNQQEHVSEEAAKMAKSMGGQGPDIEGQGTAVQDVSHAIYAYVSL